MNNICLYINIFCNVSSNVYCCVEFPVTLLLLYGTYGVICIIIMSGIEKTL